MYRKYSEIGETKAPTNDYAVMSVQNREHRMDIIKKNTIVCIKIHANWCKPCKVIAPEYAMMARDYISMGGCVCVEEDLDNGIRRDFPNIQSVPTFLLFLRGHPVDMVVGADLETLKKKIDAMIGNINRQPNQTQSAPLGYAQQGDEPLYRHNYGQNPHPNAHPSFN
jgi:thioredoxin 1